jgi:hypothetical protein
LSNAFKPRKTLTGGIGSIIVKDAVGRHAEMQGLYDGRAAMLNRKTFKAKKFS